MNPPLAPAIRNLPMSRFCLLLLTVLVTMTSEICAQNPMSASPAVLWSFPTDGPIRGGAVLAHNLLIFGSTDGSVYAVDATSGQSAWAFETGGAVSVRPVLGDGAVVLASRDGSVYALSPERGELRWSFKMGGDLPYEWGFDAYLSSPAVGNGLVYIGSGDGHLYALDATGGSERWNFVAGARIRSSPAIADGFVIFGAMNGNVYALDPATGEVAWKFETQGAGLNPADFGFDRQAVVSSPVVGDGVVVVGGRDGFLYGIDLETGAERWRVDHEVSWIMGKPIIRDGIVYTGTSDGAFVQAVDLKTGAELWRHDTSGIVWSSPTSDDHLLYIGSGDGSVLALDRASGEVVHDFHTGASVLSSPLLADGVLYVGSDDGRMYALSGMTAPTPQEFDRAVYWEDRPATKWFRNAGDEAIRSTFEASGYLVVDGDSLAAFMQDHIRSGAPSVVVFATNTVPTSVIDADTSANALLRRYLDVGRVVWLGSTPLSFVQNPGTGRTVGIDYSIPERVVGVHFDGPDVRGMGGFYRAAPTAEGRHWGLTGWWITRNAVSPSEVTTVLALDEYGKAPLWYKRYDGPEGTGLVQLWVDRDTPGPLKPLISVAEHGLARKQ